MFCGSLGCLRETKSDSVSVGDRAGGCLPHTSHHQKAGVIVKYFLHHNSDIFKIRV